MKLFTNEPLYEILLFIKENFKKDTKVSFEVVNPDLSNNSYSGEVLELDHKYIYRPYRVWCDLANILTAKMLTPIIVNEYTVRISFQKLNEEINFHKNKDMQLDEKYGLDSDFSRINKNEEASFLHYYTQALNNVNISKRKNVLNLGINKGDEFEVIKQLVSKDVFEQNSYIGIDYSKSAIAYAKERFPFENFAFYEHDINNLEELSLKKADLIISIGTLQSTSLDFKKLFMSLVQNHLDKKGSIILGFPNCRWIDGEVIYGAKAPNYNFSEQSILYKDVYFCKKYLQQKKFRVTLTGKDYLFLTATSIKK